MASYQSASCITEGQGHPHAARRSSNFKRALALMAGLGALASSVFAEDVFVITVDLTYTANDQYHYEYKFSDGFIGETRDANDTFTYQFRGKQTIRITLPKWTETYERSYSINGGGSYKKVFIPRKDPPTTESFSWSYSYDPDLTMDSDADVANLDSKFRDISVIPMPSWPVKSQSSTGGSANGSAWPTAMGLGVYTPLLHIADIPLPTNSTSYVVSRSYSTNMVVPHDGTGESGQTTAQYRCTVSIQRNPAPLEAVILPDPPPEAAMFLPAYEDWLPAGGPDEETPGTNFLVRVILRPQGSSEKEPVFYAMAKFTFELSDVSTEPGLCMNYPSKDKLNPDAGPDLRIDAKGNSLLKILNNGASAETLTGDLSESSVAISAYDYGAFGKLSVYADIPGQGRVKAFVIDHPDQDFLTLPKDENMNRIADGWEKNVGTWGEIEDPKWDKSDDPKNQDADGDGISLFEKYRGFIFANAHERLQPRRKHVFVYDPNGVVRVNLQSTMGFQTGSKLEVRFVKDDTWTGPGPAGSDKRIVNFNTSGYGHAIDQHAEHVRTVNTANPATPADYQAVYRAKHGKDDPEGVEGAFGITYPDLSAKKKILSPKAWLLIELYLKNVLDYGKRVVLYHTYGLKEFAGYSTASAADRARMDAAAQKSAQEYIDSNNTDWKEMNLKALMMVASHEMGHGVAIDDLQEPRNRGPQNCFMRYLSLADFPRNADDRFELQARWRDAAKCPTVFCTDATATVPGKGCFKQIHVTDREGGAALLSYHPTRLAHNGGGSPAPRPLDLTGRTWISIFGGPPDPLRLTTGLEWEAPLAGDPLRLTVRLSSPLASDTWEIGYLRGDTNPPPAAPAISANWLSGLQLELARIETNGTRTTILAPADWTAHLRATETDPAVFDEIVGVREREFMVSPAAARLQPGNYVLTASWRGTGLVDASLLPQGGVVTASEIRLTVTEPVSDAQRAVQLRRLAYRAWDAGQNAAAKQFGMDAIRLDPTNTSPEAIQTHFVVASTALRGGDLFGSAAALETLRAVAETGAPSSELTRRIDQLRAALLPEVHLTQPGFGAAPTRMELLGHVGQTYRLEASDDLRTWTSLQTVTAQTNRFEVTSPPATGDRKYFRVVWTQP